ncbi:MAG: TonB-dependent receptor, partial [Saprospiraceae bacterium]|nr:TonB-dependent receptor [Saprospiraceae bacterium]
WDRRHGDGFGNGGLATNTFDKLDRWNWQNTLSYNATFNDAHSLNFLLGSEEQRTIQNRWGAQRTQISDPFFTSFQGNFTTITPANNFQTENFLTSLFSRVNYSYNNKYYATFNFRRDGFSAFATDNKYGNFYGGSLGYTISEEDFWKNSLGSTINYMKLRGSYGVVGNYKNNVDGLILSVPQSPSKGIPGNSVAANVGSMVNSGIEATLTYNAVRTTDFDWTVSLNLTTQANEVTALGSDGADILGASSGLEVANITRVGESLGSLYVVQTAGVNPANGQRIFLRRDVKDGVTTYTQVQYNHAAPAASRWTLVSDGTPTGAATQANSAVVTGPTMPTYYGGLSNTFRFKSFDMSLLFQFSGGNYIYNGTKAGLRDMRQWNNHTDVLDRWTTDNTDGSIPRVVFGDNVSNGSALPISENVEKGDFVRLRNVTLGYSFPSSVTKNLRVASIRAYGQAQNALLFTNYSGSDPEISANGNSNIAPGVDRNSVGQARILTFGLQVGF